MAKHGEGILMEPTKDDKENSTDMESLGPNQTLRIIISAKLNDA